MSLALIVPVLIVLVSSVTYHLSQKYTSAQANPALALIATYFVALVGSVLLFIIYPLKNTLAQEVQHLNRSNVILGVAIIGIEIGFLLAYRAGWNVSAASLVSNLLVALVLLPVGLLLFKESLTLTNIIGVGLCVVGLILVNTKS